MKKLKLIRGSASNLEAEPLGTKSDFCGFLDNFSCQFLVVKTSFEQ